MLDKIVLQEIFKKIKSIVYDNKEHHINFSDDFLRLALNIVVILSDFQRGFLLNDSEESSDKISMGKHFVC